VSVVVEPTRTRLPEPLDDVRSGRSGAAAVAASPAPSGRPSSIGGCSEERSDAEELHVPLGEPAVVLAELRRGVRPRERRPPPGDR